MKKSNVIMIVTGLIALGIILKAFLLNEDIKMFLLIFFGIGIGLGLLRLFVNSSIKKMKGKDWKIKVLFFGVLLGFGLPFQTWFRKEVLFSMDSAYLMGSITILVLGVIFMTTFFGFIMNRMQLKQVSRY
ncbi:MFS transporter permease [Neobacillus drentensis]|uniref:MFS transporter permease n=1 Tax=Neobacillus drentensis TaxID=220684 RepID=UPI002FFEDF1B